MSAKEIHKYGTDDGWHGVIEQGGEFPPEKDRYHLYIGKPPHPLFPFPFSS
jgi:putative glutathione S-transferase